MHCDRCGEVACLAEKPSLYSEDKTGYVVTCPGTEGWRYRTRSHVCCQTRTCRTEEEARAYWESMQAELTSLRRRPFANPARAVI